MAEDKNPVVIDSWSRTKAAESATGTFCWTIEKFMDRKESNKESFKSELFFIAGPEDKLTKWRIDVYPRGNKPEFMDSVSIFLYSENDFEVTPSYKVSLLDKENKRKKCLEIKNGVHTFEGNTIDNGYGWPKYIKRNALEGDPKFLPDGNLVVFCEITLLGEEKTESGSKYPSIPMNKHAGQKTDILQNLGDDLGRALSESDCSDVHLNCGGKIFNCHEFVLSARSPVFRAMFRSNMTEKRTKSVTIADISPDAIEKMLHYIYSGEVAQGDQPELNGELLKAADKYELGMMKKFCEERLCNALELKNAIKNLIMGEMFGATKLMMAAMELLASNMSSVIDTEEWESCIKHHPALVTEVMRVMVDKKGTKRKIDLVE